MSGKKPFPLCRVLLLTSILAILAMPVFYFGGLAILMTSLCADEIIQAVPSPDRDHIAVVSVRACGATTGYLTQVHIIQNNSGFMPLRAGKARQALFAINHWHALNMHWNSPVDLMIRVPQGDRVYDQASSVGGVQIHYE